MLTSSISLIIPLADAQKSRKTGGKATNLSTLIAAHFAVPRGFVLSADAYRSQLWASGAREIASAQADAEAREAVRDAILAQTIPEDVWKSVVEAYEWLSWQTGLPEPKVAVRSSAIEDGANGMGFSGAYESYINVSGLDDLNAAIKRVWASLWSGKAAAYRIRSGSEAEPVMAVIVQQMLEADLTGTASTANPVTGDPHGVVVTVSKDSNSIRHRVDLRDFTVEQTDNSEAVTGEGLIRQIAEQSILIEDAIGGRVEIEWASDRDGLWILQAGPIPDLPEFFPIDWQDEGDARRLWTRQDPRPMSRLARSISSDSNERVLNGILYTSQDCKSDNARLHEWDKRIRPALRNRVSAVFNTDLTALDNPGLLRLLNSAAEAAGESYRWMRCAEIASARASGLISELVQDRPLRWRLLGGVKHAAFERDALLQELSDRFAIAEQSGKLNDEAWWRGFKGDVEKFARNYGYAFRTSGEAADPARWRSWIEDTDPVFRMIGAISKRGSSPTLVTLHCAAEQDALEAENQAIAELPKSKKANLRRLLESARGWIRARAETEIDCALAFTTLRLVIMEIAHGLERAGVILSAEDIFNLTLEELAKLALEPEKNLLATEIARRKHDQWLEHRLTPPAILPIDDSSPPSVSGFRESRANIFDTAKIPKHSITAPVGISAGAGVATGRARVVNTIEDASEIERGDILIIPSHSLAWTPFLALAGGVVCQSGDDMSPLAITARLYGIPAVMGCPNIPRDGKRITVDGDAGVVTL